MNVRRSFLPHQFLFATVFTVLAGALVLAESASAQHLVRMRDGRTTQAEVLGVSGTNLQVKVGAGTVGMPLANVASVEMPAPAGYAKAVEGFNSGDYVTALAETQAIVSKFRGLPTEWARQASGMLGDIHVALGNMSEAETAYTQFQEAYPGQGSLQSDVGRARIAVAREQYDDASNLLAPVAEAALQEKNPAGAPALAYSQAFYLRGRVKEASGDTAGALEDYLRTVAVFHHDPTAVKEARQRADALRQNNPELTVP